MPLRDVDEINRLARERDGLRAENADLAAEVARLRAEASAWASLMAWIPAGVYQRDVYLDWGVVNLHESGRVPVRAYVWCQEDGRKLPDAVVYCGTPEREATLAECVVAALNLWAKLYGGGEGKDGGQ